MIKMLNNKEGLEGIGDWVVIIVGVCLGLAVIFMCEGLFFRRDEYIKFLILTVISFNVAVITTSYYLGYVIGGRKR